MILLAWIFPVTALATGSIVFDFVDLRRAPVFSEDHDLEMSWNGHMPYWVCSTKNEKLLVRCEDLGVNELEGPKGELVVRIDGKRISHEYGLRHGVLMTECRKMKRQIVAASLRDKLFCFLGVRADDVTKHEDGRSEFGWVFFEFRSPTASVCDFCQ